MADRRLNPSQRAKLREVLLRLVRKVLQRVEARLAKPPEKTG